MCVLGASWGNKSVGEIVSRCPCYEGLCVCALPSCSVPTPMLRTPTLDQAHRSPRAAWDTQLPPSSRRSTRTRPTGTELHPVPSMRCRWCCRTGRAAACQEPGLGQRMYCTTTPPTCPTATTHPLPQGRVGAPTLYLVLGLDLKRKC